MVKSSRGGDNSDDSRKCNCAECVRAARAARMRLGDRVDEHAHLFDDATRRLRVESPFVRAYVDVYNRKGYLYVPACLPLLQQHELAQRKAGSVSQDDIASTIHHFDGSGNTLIARATAAQNALCDLLESVQAGNVGTLSPEAQMRSIALADRARDRPLLAELKRTDPLIYLAIVQAERERKHYRKKHRGAGRVPLGKPADLRWAVDRLMAAYDKVTRSGSAEVVVNGEMSRVLVQLRNPRRPLRLCDDYERLSGGYFPHQVVVLWFFYHTKGDKTAAVDCLAALLGSKRSAVFLAMGSAADTADNDADPLNV